MTPIIIKNHEIDFCLIMGITIVWTYIELEHYRSIKKSYVSLLIVPCYNERKNNNIYDKNLISQNDVV